MRTIIFDIETHDSDLMWDMPRDEFFRLGGYAIDGGEVRLTEDPDELISEIRRADLVGGHNIHSFDLTALFGKDSIEPLEMAREGRIFDSWTHATLAFPAPTVYTDRQGRQRYVKSPEQAMHWYSLDNLAHQLGIEGKSHDLKALAKKYGGFGEIPTSDPDFRDYLVQDVIAARDIARRLWGMAKFKGYYVREQLNAAIDAQNSRNGWRVDIERAKERVRELEDRKRQYMTMLSEKFGLPTEGKAPLRRKEGKAAILRALESVGISESDLPRTKSGAPSFGGDGLIEAARGKGDDAEELADAIASIGGMRSLAQSALDNTHADGKVHPSITTLQRSGRKSTTNPGLTVWTSRGKGAVEKSYFIPNADDELIVEFDYSQADARIVAAYSGDKEYAKRFAPGSDAHMITANLIWGEAVVSTDPKGYRQEAKPVTHATPYGARPKKLAETTGRPIEEMETYISNYEALYQKTGKWRNAVIEEGRSGWVTNAWGRKMMIDRYTCRECEGVGKDGKRNCWKCRGTGIEGREFTQAPALYGQSGTREIMVDALIRIARRDITVIQMLLAQIHDALAFSIPKKRLDTVVPFIIDCMQTTWGPPDGSGQKIHFPVECGKPAENWMLASH